MSRLYRGLWRVEATYDDRVIDEPEIAVPYEEAAIIATLLGAKRTILRRLPHSRAPWESRAPYEASDRPNWGDDT